MPETRYPQRSIKKFLLMLLLSSMTLIIFSAALHGYRASMEIASVQADKSLQALLLNLMSLNNAQTSEEAHNSSLALQIWRNEELLFSTGHNDEQALSGFTRGYSDKNFDGKRWRVLAEQSEQGDWFMVAHPIQEQIALTESLTIASINPFIYAVPLLAVILWFAVKMALNPLNKLSIKLTQRHAKDLSPITLNSYPGEMRPVMLTLNQLLSRLHNAFEREQQFTANAAHELRTPLSLLKIKLHQLSSTEDDRASTLHSLQYDVDRMIHVINQILALSRTNPETFLQQLTQINMEDVAQKVIADLYTQIDNKQQNIELVAEPVHINSSEFCLYSLLQNLVGNASKYAPEGANIRVSIAKQNGCRLVVEDSGDGLSEAQIAKMFERFYRAEQATIKEGSGLGLAIVKQIINLHQAKISASRSELGGLAVTINFPEQP